MSNSWPYSGITPEIPPPENLFVEPKQLVIGDTLFFWRSIPACSAAKGWVVKYNLRCKTGAPITFISVADGTDHKINLDPSVTGEYLPGFYSGQAHAINAAGDATANPVIAPGYTKLVWEGFIEVKQASANVVADQETRSFWRRVRDNCRVVLEGRATTDILNTTIGETTFSRMTGEQLLVLHDRAEQNVLSEENKARAQMGLGDGRHIYAEFTRAT